MEFNSKLFQTENVPTTWLMTALCIAPIALYGIFRMLSARMRRFAELSIEAIYVYPIKSLRAVKLTQAIATAHGFKYDRTFMLLEKTPSGYKNMAVSSYPYMTQFLQEMNEPENTITVRHIACGEAAKQSSITLPLTPDTTALKEIQVTLHKSPTSAFRMPGKYSEWFSQCFGYEVEFVYVGSNRRVPRFKEMMGDEEVTPSTEQAHLTFTDCAPYLFTSTSSLSNISSRLPPSSPMDITKFRPNILLSGAKTAWEEDYWAALSIKAEESETDVLLKHNCVRCKSINIDYETGKPGEGATGEVLKRMQKDRRVNRGARWSPVFGRYGFWKGGAGVEEVRWSVGDKVLVTGINKERTVWSWPGLG